MLTFVKEPYNGFWVVVGLENGTFWSRREIHRLWRLRIFLHCPRGLPLAFVIEALQPGGGRGNFDEAAKKRPANQTKAGRRQSCIMHIRPHHTIGGSRGCKTQSMPVCDVRQRPLAELELASAAPIMVAMTVEPQGNALPCLIIIQGS